MLCRMLNSTLAQACGCSSTKYNCCVCLHWKGVCSAQVGWDGHSFRHMTRHTSHSTRHIPPGRLLSATSSAPLPCATPGGLGAMAALGRHETHLSLNLKAVEAQACQGSCLAPRAPNSARLMHAPVRPASARPASSRSSFGLANAISARRPGSARRLLFSYTSHAPYKSSNTGNADLYASCARCLCFISAPFMPPVSCQAVRCEMQERADIAV